MEIRNIKTFIKAAETGNFTKTADELGVGITVHVAEDLAEFEGCVRMYGKTPLRKLP
mgnify:CR=1 FL=1